MKNLALYLSLVVTAVCLTFFSSSLSSSAQVANPSVNNPAVSNDQLLKRIQELEKKVDQLQKEMAGAKLVTTGLDKSLTNLKSTFESHTHRLDVGLLAPSVADTAERTGQNPLLLVTYQKQIMAMPPGERGAYTTAPKKN